MITVVSIVFTKENTISHMQSKKYLTSQKTKLVDDLKSVSLASGLNYNVFNGLITDQLIIQNNKDYINNIFKIVDNAKDKKATTKTAEKYAKSLKDILYNYKTKVDPKVYDMSVEGINSFVDLQKTTFTLSAAPITGVETIAAYISKLYKIKFYLLGASLIGAIILLLINIKRKIVGLSFILFFICAAGILTAALSGLGLYIITNKETVLSQSYLILVMLDYFNNVFILGIATFIVTQVTLFIMLSKNERKKKALLLSQE